MVYIPPIPKTAEELTGHKNGCDCGVCDDFTFRQSLQKGFMSIEEVHEHEKLLREENHELLERIEKWKTWYDSASEDAVKWRKDAQKFYGALVAIRDFGKESPIITTWPDAFSRLVQIASEALAE